MKKYGFGVDVGGTTVKIGFFETSGNLLDKWEIKTNTENNGASILSDIATKIDSNIRELEGVFNKIVARASLTHSPITIELAENIINEFKYESQKVISCDFIKEKVSKYFSIDKNIEVSLYTLVPNKLDRDLILELSDHSPRSLLNLCGYILDEEYDKNDIEVFSSEALSRGTNVYCKKFDYVSAQPSRTGKGQDLPTWITRLLRLKLTEFTLEQYSSFFNVKKTTTSNIAESIRKSTFL